jgi:hypothetical protein
MLLWYLMKTAEGISLQLNLESDGGKMTTRSTYKGKATLTLAAESKWPFTFGLGKAKLILENLDSIRAFVRDNEPHWLAINDQVDSGRAAKVLRETMGEADPGELAADRWNETQGGNGGAL